MVLQDLNNIPAGEDDLDLNWIRDEEDDLDLNWIPDEEDDLDLYWIPEEEEAIVVQDYEARVLDDIYWIPEEEANNDQAHEAGMLDLSLIPEEANDDPDHEEANVEHSTKINLKDKEKHCVYFALYVIKMRDGKVLPEDKQLVACLLNTSVRTVKRIWEDTNIQMQKVKKWMYRARCPSWAET